MNLIQRSASAPASAPAQEVASAAAAPSGGLSDAELWELLGGPLSVNGQEISLDDFKQALVSSVGSSQLEKRKYDIFLADELARLRKLLAAKRRGGGDRA